MGSSLLRDKPRYKVNLADQMACCEANYARLLKLMPGLSERDQWSYKVEMGAQVGRIQLLISERARYTTMITVVQSSPFGDWSSATDLHVRMYHDAQMAEVIAWSGHARLQPRYDYPNQKMYQQDEKAQLNLFLGDWLSHSLAHGHSEDEVNGYMA